ncbi:MAG: hypothetical protein CSA58_00805 [Micrococcales bacterium]|nr:MAG: hypothetical protein CSA58_00805 [Micrococcales bacterium]
MFAGGEDALTGSTEGTLALVQQVLALPGGMYRSNLGVASQARFEHRGRDDDRLTVVDVFREAAMSDTAASLATCQAAGLWGRRSSGVHAVDAFTVALDLLPRVMPRCVAGVHRPPMRPHHNPRPIPHSGCERATDAPAGGGEAAGEATGRAVR